MKISKVWSLESVKFTLYAQRVFADVEMERLFCIILVAPCVITCVLIRIKQREIWLQKKKRQYDTRSRDEWCDHKPRNAGCPRDGKRERTGSSLRSPGETSPADTWVLPSWTHFTLLAFRTVTIFCCCLIVIAKIEK